MGHLNHFDQVQALNLDSRSLSNFKHEELLELIHYLEAPESDSEQFKHDHRQHLKRAELERIVTLLQWLHRKRNGRVSDNAQV